MTAVKPTVEPAEIGAKLWETAYALPAGRGETVDWVRKIFEYVGSGRPDLARDAATSGPTTFNKED